MKRVIIQVRGANGSGKSTRVRQFIETFPNHKIVNINGMTFTKCSDEVFVLGRYDKTTSGCDRFSGKREVVNALRRLANNEKPRIIIFEGVNYGLTKTFALEVKNAFKVKGYDYIGIVLVRTLDSCINLVAKRNGNKQFNIDFIKKKEESVISSYEALKAEKINIRKIDADKINYDDMGKIIETEVRQWMQNE